MRPRAPSATDRDLQARGFFEEATERTGVETHAQFCVQALRFHRCRLFDSEEHGGELLRAHGRERLSLFQSVRSSRFAQVRCVVALRVGRTSCANVSFVFSKTTFSQCALETSVTILAQACRRLGDSADGGPRRGAQRTRWPAKCPRC